MPIGYLLINIEPGHAESVMRALERFDAVKEAYMLYGTYDIIAKIKVDNIGTLKDVVIRVRLLEKVRQTQTLVVM